MNKKMLIVISMTLAIAGLSSATPITILNADMESPGGGGFPVMDNWGVAKSALHSSFGSRPNMEGLSFGFAATEAGGFVGIANQVLGDTFVANSTYTLDMLYTENSDGADLIYSIGYNDGGTFNVLTSSAPLDAAGLTDWQRTPGLVYSTGVAGAEIGKAIEIRMESNVDAQGVWFDDVRLDVIPEPATLGLVAAFGAGILFVRRRFSM